MKLTFVHSMWGTGRPTTFESCLKNSRGGEMHISHRGVQVEPDTACVCPDEESDALRKQSCFDASLLRSSCSLVADRSSASVSGDQAAVREGWRRWEQDCFGDEEAGADMIGRETESLSFKMFFYYRRGTNETAWKWSFASSNSFFCFYAVFFFAACHCICDHVDVTKYKLKMLGLFWS